MLLDDEATILQICNTARPGRVYLSQRERDRERERERERKRGKKQTDLLNDWSLGKQLNEVRTDL